MAQVVCNGHALNLGFAVQNRQGRFIQRHIQRQRRAIAPFGQGVMLHHIIGQHGQLMAGHIDGGEAISCHFVHSRTGLHRQRGSSDVNTKDDLTRAQALHAQRIINLGRLAVVNREGLYCCQRQLISNQRCLQSGKAHTFGKLVE